MILEDMDSELPVRIPKPIMRRDPLKSSELKSEEAHPIPNLEIPDVFNDFESAIKRLDSIVGRLHEHLVPIMDMEVFEKN